MSCSHHSRRPSLSGRCLVCNARNHHNKLSADAGKPIARIKYDPATGAMTVFESKLKPKDL